MTESPFVAAIDQGTTSTRALTLDSHGRSQVVDAATSSYSGIRAAM